MVDRAATPAGKSRRWWPAVKWSLFAVMMYFVGKRAFALWQSSPATDVNIHSGWLVLATVLYLLGWLPSVWFWRALLLRLNQHAGYYESTRAYFVGHLGKYVPGKAMVLVIRAALLRPSGVNPILAALTAAYETLVAMAAAAAMAVALAPAVIPAGLWARLPAGLQFLRDQPLLVPLLVTIGTVATTPFSAKLFTYVGRKAIPQAGEAPPAPITAGLMMQGLLATSLGWAFLALSLGCTLQSLSDRPFDLTQFPVWLACISLATFIGFVIIVAPGGLGVREWVLIEILKDQPDIGPDKAILAAALLRLIWFAAELVMAGPLYLIKPAAAKPTDA